MAEVWIAAHGGQAVRLDSGREAAEAAVSQSGADGQTAEAAGTDGSGEELLEKSEEKLLPVGRTELTWAGLGLSAGILAALAAAGIARLIRRNKGKEREIVMPPGSGTVTVEKLHEQGARKSQQDSFFVSVDASITHARELIANPHHAGLLAVVADGMGGLSDGDRISQTAVTAVANSFAMTQGAPEQVLLALLARANQAVNALLGPEGLRTGGSTMVMGLLRGGQFYYLSVGDSRICLFRNGVLYQLNREHVFRNELYLRAANGEMSLAEAAGHPKGGGLTSFLGMGQLAYVDLPAQPVEVRLGDRFVLMSDGVYNALPEEELTGLLAAGGGADALRAAIQAKGYTNQDNYTAVILTC